MFYSSSRSSSGTTTIMDLSNVHHETTAEIGMQASDSKLLVGRLLASLPQASGGGGGGTNGHSQQQTSSANIPPVDDSKMSGAAKVSKPNASAGATTSKVVRYRECMKNHAASIGGHALDGCGEFMPSGEEGTIEALKCAACDCHRNFHKREVEGEPLICDMCHMNRRERNRKAAAIAAGVPQNNVNSPGPAAASGGTPSPLPLSQQKGGATGGMNLLALTTRDGSEADQLAGGMMSPMSMKKRFRTKFSMDQKERMYLFAEKLGWRIQKHDEAAVQQFCAEVGVKRHVLKVWMHNNKHTFGKRSSSLMTASPSALLHPPAGTSVPGAHGDSGPSSTPTPPPPPHLNPPQQ